VPPGPNPSPRLVPSHWTDPFESASDASVVTKTNASLNLNILFSRLSIYYYYCTTNNGGDKRNVDQILSVGSRASFFLRRTRADARPRRRDPNVEQTQEKNTHELVRFHARPCAAMLMLPAGCPPQKHNYTTQPNKQIPKFRFEIEMLQLIRVVLVVHAPVDEVARNMNS
jgi:hypothetical protein